MSEVIKPKMTDYRRQVQVCVGSKCTQHGEGLALYNELKEKLKASGLDKGNLRVIRSKTSCLGTCRSGPLLSIQPDGVWYYDINSEKLDRIISEHLLQGKPVIEYIYHQA
ncbi:MAG: (2Fe-2S) ferredoxin domain-containing protein [Methylococcales bacterium]|nr:(2Fe-2S) ferredoxin domain-containing protein [Methylococcales bacterium]